MHRPVIAALLIAASTAALAAPTAQDQRLAKISAPVSPARMKADVEKMVSFGTRHTLSSQTDPKRGIGASLRWAEGELRKLGLGVETPSEMMTGARVPTPVRIIDVLGIQRGTSRPNDVVLVMGHIDSRVSEVMNAAADAPGANDDGSGSAAVLEAARVLSRHKFAGTIVYALLSGEEQGLYGGKILAAFATAQGWNVVAALNNDFIGNSCGSDGVCDDKTVRIFSEGPRWQGHERLAGQLRSLGGENDAPSRNLSRFIDRLAERVPSIGLDVMQVWRNDRFGRGGDHTELLNAGFPAVRLSVAVENYNWQHQDLRTEKGIEYGDTIDKMNFPYLAKVTKLNVAALAAMASAPPPPEPRVEGAVSSDTTLTWPRVGTTYQYRVRWRGTDSNQWDKSAEVVAPPPIRPLGTPFTADSIKHVLPHVRVDDWVFGVSSVSKDGFESPVASAVPGGAFKPYVPPVDKK
jgi:hypothetical protein